MAQRLQEVLSGPFPSDSRVAVSEAQGPSLEAGKPSGSEPLGTEPEN